MKLSNAVQHLATFGLSAIGILTVAGILSLAERNLHTTEVVAHGNDSNHAVSSDQSDHDDTESVDHFEAASHDENMESPQVWLRSGYIGDFGYVAPATSSAAPEAELGLPEVVLNTPVATTLPVPSPSAPSSAEVVQLQSALASTTQVERPIIRVGLFTVDSTEQVVASVNKRSSLVLVDGTVIKQRVRKNTRVKLSYNVETGEYTAQNKKFVYTGTEPVRIEPAKKRAIVKIHSYENRPAWNTELNDNLFLGRLELQYAPETGNIWAINELGIERYLQGIAEAGNDNDKAYLRALMTAARTYVYTIGDKHADEPYDVNTTPNDQVYRGYGLTLRAPNVAKAVRATRGRVVHYNGEPAITPYFSTTDGRTRSWEEVWNGSKEYLVSKEDPCCTDSELLGHGVGMSAAGARYFAEEENWGWKQILKYYYTGITIEQVW